jgi:hypothetical protein
MDERVIAARPTVELAPFFSVLRTTKRGDSS